MSDELQNPKPLILDTFNEQDIEMIRTLSACISALIILSTLLHIIINYYYHHPTRQRVHVGRGTLISESTPLVVA